MIRFALLFILLAGNSYGQRFARLSDSLRKAYKIPAMSYAVVSADSILEIATSGVTKIGTNRAASLHDRYRIGSNTKAVTGFIAAELVHQGKLRWDTRFFDVFPELLAGSVPAYHDLTLQQLLSFRAPLIPYTYTSAIPHKEWFTGNDSLQRYEFARWFLQQRPPVQKDTMYYTNLGYVAAGLMLEKVSGRSYRDLVKDLDERLDLDFETGQPNTTDTLQPWGHDAAMRPEPPGDSYKLNWLLAAGNINATLPGYARFIQMQLKGLQGRTTLLTKEEYYFLHYGLKPFSIGWFCDAGQQGEVCSYNVGNPGTFLSKVYVWGRANRAFIIFANVQSDRAEEGMDILYEKLRKAYLK